MILSTLVTSQLHFEMCAGLYGHPVYFWSIALLRAITNSTTMAKVVIRVGIWHYTDFGSRSYYIFCNIFESGLDLDIAEIFRTALSNFNSLDLFFSWKAGLNSSTSMQLRSPFYPSPFHYRYQQKSHPWSKNLVPWQQLHWQWPTFCT